MGNESYLMCNNTVVYYGVVIACLICFIEMSFSFLQLIFKTRYILLNSKGIKNRRKVRRDKQ